MNKEDALIVIDMQNDFMPGGSLGVAGGNELPSLINAAAGKFDNVIYSKDWHPADHCSFTIWPPHCVQYTFGAQLVESLILPKNAKIVYKGMNSHVDSYSAFFDNDHTTKTALDDYLRRINVKKLYFCGVAYDFCVKFSVLDAAKLGYDTFLISDLVKGIASSPYNRDDVKKELSDNNVKFIELKNIK